jgi:hypothetical protein
MFERNESPGTSTLLDPTGRAAVAWWVPAYPEPGGTTSRRDPRAAHGRVGERAFHAPTDQAVPSAVRLIIQGFAGAQIQGARAFSQEAQRPFDGDIDTTREETACTQRISA